MDGSSWAVMWKLFHRQFWWICLVVGVPIRFLLARWGNTTSATKAGSYAIASGIVASTVSTWFPVIPLAGGAILLNLFENAASESSLTYPVPMVAVLMGVETALLDAIFVRVLLRGSARVGFMALLVANVLNTAIALALGLAWAYRHMPTFIAVWGGCR